MSKPASHPRVFRIHRPIFHLRPRHFPWRIARPALQTAAMTRASIERSIKIFLVALILTFLWTVWKVGLMVGWF